MKLNSEFSGKVEHRRVAVDAAKSQFKLLQHFHNLLETRDKMRVLRAFDNGSLATLPAVNAFEKCSLCYFF
jgi:hypothetical protein